MNFVLYVDLCVNLRMLQFLDVPLNNESTPCFLGKCEATCMKMPTIAYFHNTSAVKLKTSWTYVQLYIFFKTIAEKLKYKNIFVQEIMLKYHDQTIQLCFRCHVFFCTKKMCSFFYATDSHSFPCRYKLYKFNTWHQTYTYYLEINYSYRPSKITSDNRIYILGRYVKTFVMK